VAARSTCSKTPDVLNVIRLMRKKIIYQDSVIDELQSEKIALLGLVVETLDRKIELLEQSKGKETEAAPRKKRKRNGKAQGNHSLSRVPHASMGTERTQEAEERM
jgi:hypothetical protein